MNTLVTHEPDIANHMDRIVQIRDGKLDKDFDNLLNAEEARKSLVGLLAAPAKEDI